MPSSDPSAGLLKKFFFVAVTLLLGAGFLELFLRVTYPLYRDYNTEMWRYSSELKRPSDFPGLPFEHVPGKTVRLYGAEVRTNNAGWRADRDVEPAKPAGRKRLVFLGDSVTMGWGVAFEDTFARVVERELARGGDWEVLNTGVGNYNLACELAAFRKALAYRPDAAVLVLTINDAEILQPVRTPFLWFERRFYIYGFLWSKLTSLRYRMGVAKPYADYYSALYVEGSPQREEFARHARELAALAKENGVPLLVVAVPELHDVADDRFRRIYDFMRGLIGADFVYLKDDLAAFPSKSLWVSAEDAHPNALGHRAIAQAVLRELRRRGIAP